MSLFFTTRFPFLLFIKKLTSTTSLTILSGKLSPPLKVDGGYVLTPVFVCEPDISVMDGF